MHLLGVLEQAAGNAPPPRPARHREIAAVRQPRLPLRSSHPELQQGRYFAEQNINFHDTVLLSGSTGAAPTLRTATQRPSPGVGGRGRGEGGGGGGIMRLGLGGIMRLGLTES